MYVNKYVISRFYAKMTWVMLGGEERVATFTWDEMLLRQQQQPLRLFFRAILTMGLALSSMHFIVVDVVKMIWIIWEHLGIVEKYKHKTICSNQKYVFMFKKLMLN